MTPPQTLLLVHAFSEFPLGVASLAAALAEKLPDVRVLVRDYRPVQNGIDVSFYEDLEAYRPSIVGFSCHFWSLALSLQLASVVKAVAPTTLVVLGGPQVGGPAEARALLGQHPQIDALVHGEGEEALVQLAERRWSNASLEGLSGVSCRVGDQIRPAAGWATVARLESLPRVLDEANDLTVSLLAQARVATVETARGCKHRCAYCCYPMGAPRLKPLEVVASELRFVCGLRLPRVRIADAHLGFTRRRALRVFEILRRHNRGTVFSFYPDPHHVDQAYVDAAVAAGARPIGVALQTTDPGALALVGRPPEEAVVAQAVEHLRGRFPEVQVDVMLGLPDDGYTGFRASVGRALQMAPGRVMVSRLMVLPGTPLAARADELALQVDPLPPRFVRASRGFPAAEVRRAQRLALCLDLCDQLPHLKGYLAQRLALTDLALWLNDDDDRAEHAAVTAREMRRASMLSLEHRLGPRLAELVEQLRGYLAQRASPGAFDVAQQLVRLDARMTITRRRHDQLRRRWPSPPVPPTGRQVLQMTLDVAPWINARPFEIDVQAALEHDWEAVERPGRGASQVLFNPWQLAVETLEGLPGRLLEALRHNGRAADALATLGAEYAPDAVVGLLVRWFSQRVVVRHPGAR